MFVNITLLPALSVSGVVFTRRSDPRLRLAPTAVDRTGVLILPKVRLPLKLTVPAPVMESFPDVKVNGLLKVIVPVDTLMTSVAAVGLDVNHTDPMTVNDPVVTAICDERDAVVFTPPRVISPVTTAMLALTFQDVVTPAVGWLMMTLPFTVSEAACVKELAAELGANVRSVHEVFVLTV